MIKKFNAIIKNHIHEVVKTKKSAHSIALGFAIGTLISILPTPGFNILLGLLVVLIYKKVNKFTLFGAMVIWNPITLTPLYLLSFKLGNLIFGSEPIIKYEIEILNQVYNFSRRFLLGNLIIGIIVSNLSYFIVKKLTITIRKRKYHGKKTK